MTDDSGTIRRIDWRGIFPWLILFRTFRIAIAPAVLTLAVVAVLVSIMGTSLIDFALLKDDGAHSTRGFSWPNIVAAQGGLHSPTWLDKLDPRTFSSSVPISQPIAALADSSSWQPKPELTYARVLRHCLVSILYLVVWALVGGAICRRALLELAMDEVLSLEQMLGFARQKFRQLICAPLYPLGGMVIFAALLTPLGWLLRTGWGTVMVGLVWPLVLVASILAAVLALGLFLAWFLLIPAIAAERDCDEFDAFGRAFSYLYGKPLNYFFYVVVASLFFGTCVFGVNLGAKMVVDVSFWGVSWGAGAEQTSKLLALNSPPALTPVAETAPPWGLQIIAASVRLLWLVSMAISCSLFWTLSSGIYLLLRKDVDSKEMDEVYREDDPRPMQPQPAPPPPPRDEVMSLDEGEPGAK